MKCLKLDCIQLNNEYLRLPSELLDCCAAITTHPNMSKDLVSAMQRMLTKYQNNLFSYKYIPYNLSHQLR